jgi:acetylornithine deacetylase/succinyl-diaminopimelate desuccinylase-like protein
VTISGTEAGDGWAAPATAPWLRDAADDGSRRWFGEPAASWGIGGSIPFMAMLGHDFPDAQFLITGVIGPGCNIHGPNEFLDLEYARKLTGAVSDVLAAHAR